MNGFFNQLLAQNRGTAESLRPRRASVFEPAGGVSSAQSWEESVEQIPASLEEIAIPEQSEQNKPAPRSARPSPPPEPFEMIERREQPARPHRTERTSPPQATIEPSAPLAAPQRLAPPPSAAIPPIERSIIEERVRLIEAPSDGQPPSGFRPSMPPLGTLAPTGSTHERPSYPPQQSPRSLVTPAMPSLAVPPVRPRFEAQRVATRAPATPPTVHVTIGAVEVRAVGDPAPKRAKSPAANPVMSLEEYLKQRAGGGRA